MSGSTCGSTPARSPRYARERQARPAEAKRYFCRFAEPRQHCLSSRIFRKAPARALWSDLFRSSPSRRIHCLEFLEHRQDFFLSPRSRDHRSRCPRSVVGLVRLEAHSRNLRTSRTRPRPRTTRSNSRHRQTSRTAFRNDQPLSAGLSRSHRFLDDILIALSLDGEIRAANRRFTELVGLNFQQIIGKKLADFLDEAGGQGTADALEALPRFLERRNWSGVVQVRLKSR